MHKVLNDHKAFIKDSPTKKRVSSMSKKFKTDLSKIEESVVSADMTVIHEKNETI